MMYEPKEILLIDNINIYVLEKINLNTKNTGSGIFKWVDLKKGYLEF